MIDPSRLWANFHADEETRPYIQDTNPKVIEEWQGCIRRRVHLTKALEHIEYMALDRPATLASMQEIADFARKILGGIRPHHARPKHQRRKKRK